MSQDKLVIYHNPRCSKSREALQLLEENKMSPEIIEYLEEPPTAAELTRILALLGIGARELLRNTEQVYKDAGLDDDSLSDEEIIETICGPGEPGDYWPASGQGARPHCIKY
jgi:arsenate reductase